MIILASPQPGPLYLPQGGGKAREELEGGVFLSLFPNPLQGEGTGRGMFLI